MEYQKGFIVPAFVLAGLVLLSGALYYYEKDATTTLPTSTASVALMGITDGGVLDSENNTTPDTYGTALVPVSTGGTLAQRLNLQTFTDLDYSYAISHPDTWSASGQSSLMTVTNGRSSIVIQAQNITPGINATAFAAENGAQGFTTTAINAYEALETTEGNQSVYYIVNGAVGYRIGVVDMGDSSMIHTILLTFTVTKQR